MILSQHEFESVELSSIGTQGDSVIYISNLDPTTPAAHAGFLQVEDNENT